MIRLNCFIKVVSQENKGRVLAAASELTEASLNQDGCIAYDIFESATRPDVLMICETWRDQAALDAHTASGVFESQVAVIKAYSEMKLESFNF